MDEAERLVKEIESVQGDLKKLSEALSKCTSRYYAISNKLSRIKRRANASIKKQKAAEEQEFADPSQMSIFDVIETKQQQT